MKYILSVLTLIVVSFYFFPVDLRFLPIVNTKAALAGVGLIVLIVQLAKNRNGLISKDVLLLSIFAAFVSLASVISVVFNGTPDYVYATYIVSMWVWLSAAYVVISLIRWVHGTVSVYLLCNYLIALCVAQCVLALIMDFSKPVQDFIFSLQDDSVGDFFTEKKRLSGFGAGLDVAGSRFSAVLIMISFLCVNNFQKVKPYLFLYILAFVIIGVIGNMIGRTTTVGLVIAMAYFVVGSFIYMSNADRRRLWLWILGILMVNVVVLIYAYYDVPEMYQNLRFGFEGFFSLVEEGRWEVHSNEMLSQGYIFPDNLKTWLIGDGFFGTTNIDPYYTGVSWGGFYKGSDVGYSRFLFYFGLIGLSAFSIFMLKVCNVCVRRFHTYSYMFLMFVVVNFLVWLKVSTDIFLVFAPFLCISKMENELFEARFAATEYNDQ